MKMEADFSVGYIGSERRGEMVAVDFEKGKDKGRFFFGD